MKTEGVAVQQHRVLQLEIQVSDKTIKGTMNTHDHC